jgi:hypothetical protein
VSKRVLTAECAFCGHEQWIHRRKQVPREVPPDDISPQSTLWLWNTPTELSLPIYDCAKVGCDCLRFNQTEVDDLLERLAGL